MQDAKMIIYERLGKDSHMKGPFVEVEPGFHIMIQGRIKRADGAYLTEKEAFELVLDSFRHGTLMKDVPTWNAMFNVAVWDEHTDTLTWINDRFSYHPFFFAHTKKGFMISDDFTACITALEHTSLNESSMLEFLRYRFITGERTLFNELTCLPAASISVMDLKSSSPRWSSKVHFRFRHRPGQEGLKHNSKRYNDILATVIEEELAQLDSQCKVFLTLTGGADSRFLLSHMLPYWKENWSAITFGAKGSEDLEIAKEIAGSLGVRHRMVDLNEDIKEFFELEFIDAILRRTGQSTFHYQGYAMERMLKRLNPSDHLFTGVDGFWVGLNARKELLDEHVEPRWLPRYLYGELGAYLSPFLVKRLTGIDEKKQESTLLKCLEAQVFTEEDIFSGYIDFLFKNKARRYISSDFSTSQSKVHLHYPFDDHRLIDHALSMPSDQLIHQNVYMKAMMDHAFEGSASLLANVPFEMADLKPYGEDSFRLVTRPRPFVERLLNKFSSRPDPRQSYPIASYVQKNWPAFVRQLNTILEASPSTVIDHDQVRKIAFEMRTKDLYFFHKQMSSILSLLRMEQKTGTT